MKKQKVEKPMSQIHYILAAMDNIIECNWYKYEKKMNHIDTKNICHGAGNMPFFEINPAGSIAAHWKYDSITVLKKCTCPYNNTKIKKY